MRSSAFFKRLLACALALSLFLAAPAALAKYSMLEFGDRGSAVLKLQKALLALGFDPNGTDGKFGRGTENAVKAYQQARGLTADGKAGDLTLTKLYSETDGSTGSSTSGSTATNPNTLQYGDSGDRVTELQTALKKLGYYTGTVDGRFGAGTQRAVIAFQKAQGLTADGLAGTRTQEKLYALASGSSSSTSSSSSSSATASGFTRTLRRGYTGSDVKSVQTRLKELGYYTGSVDGEYGSGSIAAVKAFQRASGLTADGLCGKATWNALMSSSAVSSGSSSSSSSSTGTSSGSYVKLQSGDTGDAVKALQKALNNLGYAVSADGSYGALTVAAVKSFQQINGLDADGIAGAKTQTLLYSGNAKKYSASASDSSGSSSSSSSSGASSRGSFTGKNGKTIQLLHWFDEVKPSLKTGQNLTVYEPTSGITFTLYVMSRGRHADVEPLTAEDTAKMMEAWNNEITWTPKAVYIGLPDGRWTLATMHNVAHGSQVIGDSNNFDGQNCVHFLRDMDECTANDPNYGVKNQTALRKAWKAATGITIN